DHARMAHALAVLEHARCLMETEGGQPRVVIAAALLHDIGIREAERKHNSAAPEWHQLEGPPIARRILTEAGVDRVTLEHVSDIVATHHSAGKIDTLEFRIVCDADRLVNLSGVQPERTDAELREFIERTFETEAGRRRAYDMFQKQTSLQNRETTEQGDNP
ncbi:MAG TPA: HD domain-containing protein, partial [Planctomycetota bacterium]|nr:HD domain-containing protein [Planctomycetota bacterium]